jgi:ubiquinone/menaquinone biosynthesis C-methylase UbiE
MMEEYILGRLTLDIGSGRIIEGHRLTEGNNIIHADIDRRAINLEILCSIYDLPFKDQSIPIVLASHLFEHLEEPIRALKELKRITNLYVIIKVPNGSFYKVRPSGIVNHIFSWNEWTLKTFLNRVFEDVEVKPTTRWNIFGNKYFSTLKKIKRIIERGFFGKSELTAICRAKL